jgi:hypothetical protein
MSVLAEQAHWVLDGLDGDSAAFVRHLVPPVPRFIVIRVLPWRYRRKKSVLWEGTRAAGVPSLPAAVDR